MTLHIRVAVFLIFFGFSLTLCTIIGAVVAFNVHAIEDELLGYVVKIGTPDATWRGYIIKRESGREVEVGCPHYAEIEKLADAVLHKYDFEVQTPDSNWIPVSTEAADDDHQRAKGGMISHKIGAKWPRDFCFEMPGTIADDQPMRVRGVAEHYRKIFGFAQKRYLSITPVPEFIILPRQCYKVDGSIDHQPKECRLTTWPPPR